MLNLNTIKKAFDKTIDVILENSSDGLRYCVYDHISGFNYKSSKKKTTTYNYFVPMWLPDSFMKIIATKEDIKWSSITNSIANEDAISNRTYNNTLLDAACQKGFIEEFADHISKTINENCNRNKELVSHFLVEFCNQLTNCIKEDTGGKYIQSDTRLIMPSSKLIDYVTIFEPNYWSYEDIIRQIAVLSLIAFFPANISEKNKVLLTDISEQSIPKDFRARHYFKNRERYKEFRKDEYQLTINKLSRKVSGQNNVVIVSAPGGEGKTALASYIYYYFNHLNDTQRYKHIWWLDFSTSLEEAIIKSNDVVKCFNSTDFYSIISNFIDEIDCLSDSERVLLIIDNLNKDRNTGSDSRIDVKEMLQHPNLDILITTRLGQDWKNGSDWRSIVPPSSWIELKNINNQTAESVFYFYYGKNGASLNNKEKEVVHSLLDLSANNILAIQLLASGARFYKQGLLDYYKEIRESGFRFPNQYIYTEHSTNIDDSASMQICMLYNMDLNELDDCTKNLIWYFALPESGVWFSENDIEKYFADKNTGRKRHADRCYDAETLSSRGWLIFDPEKGYMIHDIIRLSFLNKLKPKSSREEINKCEIDYILSQRIRAGLAPDGIFSEYVTLVADRTEHDSILSDPREMRIEAILNTACLKYIKLNTLETVSMARDIFNKTRYFDVSRSISFFEEFVKHLLAFTIFYHSRLEIKTTDKCLDLQIEMLCFLSNYFYTRNETGWKKSFDYTHDILSSITGRIAHRLDDYKNRLKYPKDLDSQSKDSLRSVISIMNKSIASGTKKYQQLANFFSEALLGLPVTTDMIEELLRKEDEEDDIRLTYTTFAAYHNYVRKEDDFFKYNALFGFADEIKRDFIKVWTCAPQHREVLVSSLISYGYISFLIDPAMTENTVLKYLFTVLFMILKSIQIDENSNIEYPEHFSSRNLLCLLGNCYAHILSIRVVMNMDHWFNEHTFNEAVMYSKRIMNISFCKAMLKEDSLLYINLSCADYWFSVEQFSKAKELYLLLLYSSESKSITGTDDYYTFALQIHCKTGIMRCDFILLNVDKKEMINTLIEEIESSCYKDFFSDDIEVIENALSFPRNYPLVGTCYHYAPLKTQKYIVEKYWLS